MNDVESVFTHLSGSYANLLEQKKVFTYEKGWTCTGLIWKTNMADVSLFWNTNIADMVTSCENTLFTICTSLRKKPISGDVTTGFPAKWRLRDDRRNSIPMTRNYPDLGSASDWSCRVGNLIQSIRSTTQIWVVTRRQYGISLVSQTSFGGLHLHISLFFGITLGFWETAYLPLP